MGFWGGKERRKYARILRTVPCKLKVGNETLAGSTQNISENGVLIEMYSVPDTLDSLVGQPGQFFLLISGKEMELASKVHRIDGLSLALEFSHDTRSEAGQALKTFIEDETLPADDSQTLDEHVR